jgi:serine/threonine-protein kinase
MSPEQARGETLDARSDIYSLGIIFYEMLTARLPFPRSKPMEYIAHHINPPPYKITERRPELNLPEALNPIVDKAIEKGREARYGSAAEFAAAIETLLPRGERGKQVYSAPAPGRAPAERGEVRPTADLKAERGGRSVGRGLVVALIAVIVVLLCVVIWLFATRASQPAIVPVAPMSGLPPPAAPIPPAN